MARQSESTLSGPSAVRAAAVAWARQPASLIVGRNTRVYETSQEARWASAAPSVISRMRASTSSLSASVKVRASPRMTTRPGMALRAPSVTSSVHETTTESRGVDIARDDGLQGQDDLGADDHGVDDEVRGRSVPAPAGDADLEVVLRGHDRSAARVDLTGGQAGNVVQSVDLIDGEPVEQSIGDHRLGAGSRLLRRLEDQADGAVEGDVGGQRRGGSEDHRHVSVVPAGVHCSDVLRSV